MKLYIYIPNLYTRIIYRLLFTMITDAYAGEAADRTSDYIFSFNAA